MRGMVDTGLKISVLPSTGNLTYAQMRGYADYLRSVETYFAAAPFIAPESVTDRVQEVSATRFGTESDRDGSLGAG